MIVIRVSLEDQPLAMLNRNAGYTRLNICLRGDDKIISPEPLRGNRGNGLETSAKRSSIELKGGWKAVSAFIIICSVHVHWFVLQLKLISIQSIVV